MGASEVHGIDCNQGMIETFRSYLGILPFDLPISPRVGDVAALPYEDASFDVVLSHEAVSHYPDVDAFMTEAYRVLRPGGVLLLSDSNNALNRKVREETWEIWRAFEMGPAGVRVHGHTIEEPFVAQRVRIIRDMSLQKQVPSLDKDEIDLLAQHTSGLAGVELRQAVERYVSTCAMPEHVYREGTCPIDPVQGYYIEYLFDPYALARQLEDLGFCAHLRAYLGGARGPLLAWINRALTWEPLTPWVLPHARAFRIAAIKDGR
jgi:SAM-dependent methyltransferase